MFAFINKVDKIIMPLQRDSSANVSSVSLHQSLGLY